MPNLRRIITTFAVTLLVVTTIAGMVQMVYPESTNGDVPNKNTLVQEATSLIEANQILIENRYLSTFVAIGEVKKVESITLDYETGKIATNAEICVDVPLTENIHANDTITVRYVGGTVGNMTLWVKINWAYGPEDTVRLPGEFKLDIGATIMFFAKEEYDHVKLLTYVPFSIDNASTSNDYDAGEGYMLPLSEPQPSTTVNEVSGYGFEWFGIHRYWSDLPVKYYIDPDGTADIAGTSEFDAIRAAFATWEDLRFSGIDFTDMGTGINVASFTKDGYNILLWITRNDQTWVSMTYGWPDPSDPLHTIETDIEFNDRYAFCIGAQANCYDVQSIATHEIGHWLTLEDLDSSAQTMYGIASTNSIAMRSLKWGDENGAHYVYPIHNDANQGGDGSNTFSGASSVIKNTAYYGRLCDLPTPDHTLDTQDYFKIYAGSTSRLAFVLHPPANADFDLELYNPSGQLVAYSRTRTNGGSETITRDPMGVTGYWRIRIYRYSTGGQGGNGQYYFRISDIPLKYRL
jgi:hypothetical protein